MSHANHSLGAVSGVISHSRCRSDRRNSIVMANDNNILLFSGAAIIIAQGVRRDANAGEFEYFATTGSASPVQLLIIIIVVFFFFFINIINAVYINKIVQVRGLVYIIITRVLLSRDSCSGPRNKKKVCYFYANLARARRLAVFDCCRDRLGQTANGAYKTHFCK